MRGPYSILLPVGFAVPLPLPVARCALAAPFHPCPYPEGQWTVCSLWHFPWPRRTGTAGRYPAPFFRGARTFLGAFACNAAARPS